MRKRQIKTSDEQNAYTDWRKVMIWRPGEIKRIKRRTHKRERREAKQQITEESNDQP